MAGAGTVRGADIHGDSDEAGVEPVGARLCRQAHHGGGTAETRHLVAAQGLIEISRHDRFLLTLFGSQVTWPPALGKRLPFTSTFGQAG
jgi:hypothetical protein